MWHTTKSWCYECESLRKIEFQTFDKRELAETKSQKKKMMVLLAPFIGLIRGKIKLDASSIHFPCCLAFMYCFLHVTVYISLHSIALHSFSNGNSLHAKTNLCILDIIHYFIFIYIFCFFYSLLLSTCFVFIIYWGFIW